MAIDAAPGIALTLNGREVELPRAATVATLVEGFAPSARMVAVERNGEIVPRLRWEATPLVAGDRVELVRFVQGG